MTSATAATTTRWRADAGWSAAARPAPARAWSASAASAATESSSSRRSQSARPSSSVSAEYRHGEKAYVRLRDPASWLHLTIGLELTQSSLILDSVLFLN